MSLHTSLLERTVTVRAIRRIRSVEVPFVIALAVAVLALFGSLAQSLALDLDEAYYVIAGTFVSSGKLPYRDFFFPQTPLSAYVFGAWSKLFGVGFVSSRYLGAILAAAVGWVIAATARRRVGIWHALLALGYYCLSIQVVLWMPRLKTYGLSSLLTVLALVCITSLRANGRAALAAGLFAGLSISTRLLFVPVPVLVLVGILLREDLAPNQRRNYCVWALLGTLLGMLPVIASALRAPDAFVFDNVSYHALRDGNERLVDNFGQKFRVLRAQISLRGATKLESLQFLILVPTSIALLFRRKDVPRHLRVFPLAALSLLFVSFLPSPVYRQYLVTVVPPAILSLVLLGLLDSKQRLGIAALLLFPYAYACYASTAPLLREASHLGPAANDAVGHAVRTLTRPGDLVAGLRAHLLFAADRPIEPCSYNSFARRDWQMLSAERIRAYHLCSNDDIVKAIQDGRVKAFVARPNEDLGLADELERKGWTRTPGTLATIWTAPALTKAADPHP